MKTLALIFVLGFASPAMAQTGWRIFAAEAVQRTLSNPPEVTLKQIQRDSVTVRLTNSSKNPLFYRGYSDEHPVFYIDEFVNGQWCDSTWASCGTGLAQRILPPGTSRELTLPKPPSKRFRIYTRLSDSKE